MAAHAGPPGFDEEADNWEAYRLRLEAYFEVHDITNEKKRRGQLNISVTYGGTTLDATLVVLGCSGPDLCGRDVIKALEQHGRQVLAVGLKAAPAKPSSTKDDLQVQQLLDEFQDLFSEELGLIKGPPVELRLREDTEHPGTTRQVGDSVWYRNYGTGARWKAGVVQTPEGCRMVTIKAADAKHHRRHYDQLRGRETDSTGLAAGEAEVKQEPGVEAPQTEAGETGAPLTSREPQSPGPPETDARRIATSLKGKEG
ncbi:hypothetical protein MRX96_055492 [Rhipicephalus microplus]